MTAVRLRCPSCLGPMPSSERCSCGFRPRPYDGVLDLMTSDQEAVHADFVAAYERIRREEGWGAGDLDLPFHAVRNRPIWAIRRRTFRKFRRFVRAQLPRGGTALEVGAGNCWLTGHLSRWGFDVTAVDVNAGSQDGLVSGAYHLERGCRFDRIRAPMEALPFSSGTFDIVVSAASLHYARDKQVVLREFHRVLHSGGLAVILDSPCYERRLDGERAVGERVAEYTRAFGLDERLARRSSYLLLGAFESLVRATGFSYRQIRVWPGPRRTLERLRATCFGQRIARFPLLVLRRQA